MVRFGAKETGMIVYKNQWWRLLSSTMLHGGIFHMIPNGAIQVYIRASFVVNVIAYTCTSESQFVCLYGTCSPIYCVTSYAWEVT